MLRFRRKLAAATVGAMLAIGVVAPAALAGGDCYPPPPPPPSKSKCNSGNGNGSESLTNTDHCTNGDPGNSFAAGNHGGDEVPPGELNPGGNNVGPID
jgi:hypothetical protein